MGLELLELTLETEKVFNIRLTDDEACRCATPRQVIDLVWRKLDAARRVTCLSQHAFYQLRQAIMRVLGAPRANIRPTTPIRAIFSSRSDGERWLELRQALDPVAWPPVGRPLWLRRAIVGAVVIFACGLGSLLGRTMPEEWAAIFLGTLVGTIIFATMCVMWTRRWRNRISGYNGTLRDLVPYLQPTVYTSREQVAQRYKLICMKELGLSEKQYMEDADFVYDWNCG